MIIVSQDKRKIVNFEQSQEIEINTPEDFSQGFVSIDTYPTGEGSHNHIRLGIYESESRAKEVLQGIILTYSNFELSKNLLDNNKDLILNLIQDANYQYFDVFEMPEE